MFLIILIIFSFTFTVDCKTTDRVIVENTTAKAGRLFTIIVGMDTDSNLTASTFTLEYDDKCIDFRKAEELISDSRVEAHAQKGKVKAIFLKSTSVSSKACQKLFSVTFKAEKQCDTTIKITCSDCVNSKLKNFTPPKSTACRIKINASSSSCKNKGSNKNSYKNNVTNKKDKDNTAGTEENKGKKIKKDYVTRIVPDKTFLIIITTVLIILAAIGGYLYERYRPRI